MKMTLIPVALAGVTALAAYAGPLQKEHVSADALRTQLGGYIGSNIVSEKLFNPLAELKDNFGVELDWRKFQSFTAYGTDYETRADDAGVLIIKSGQDIPAMLDKVMAKLEDASGVGSAALKRKKSGGQTFYSLNDDAHGAAGKGGVFVMGKSRARVEKALEVLDGKGSTLATAKTFAGFPPVSDSFFFLGLAEGFNSAAALPPQARVFKNSNGGQLSLGEKAGQVMLQLSLSAKDAEATAQIQQVFQGLLALATLSQEKNKDLAELAQAVKVSTNSTFVNVSVQVSATNVIAKVREGMRKLGQ
jgi:hypothetical protein